LTREYKKTSSLVCEYCGEHFIGSKKTKYCSDICKSRTAEKNRKIARIRKIKCQRCGIELFTSDSKKIFCSRVCQINKSKPAVTKICPICGCEFETAIPNKKYCSDICHTKNKNTKQRGKDSRKLEGLSCEKCGFSDTRALHMHHINRKNSNNTMCLCANCHNIFHSIVGRNIKAESKSKEEVIEILGGESDMSILLADILPKYAKFREERKKINPRF